MASSIGDWYADAEGRHSDHGHDWENDDQPDRNRDSWLDRLPREEPRIPPPSRSAPRKPRTGRQVRRVPEPTSRAPRPYYQEVVNAAHALRAKHPGMGDKALARRLRDLGYTTVKQSDVRAALRRDPGPVPSERHNKGIQAKRLGSLAVPVGQPIASGRTSDFVVAVRTFWIKAPDLSLEALTRLLHGRGWTAFTQDDVRKVLRSLESGLDRDRNPSRTAAGKGGAVRSGRKRRGDVATAVPGSRADICPSCGVAVSSSGQCRCS